MNLQVSQRRLIGNAIAAMVAAIEVYNKPRFDYRNEIFTILLVNAWELALKAVLSKAGKRIYYRKKPNQPYRSYSLNDAFEKAVVTSLWPSSLEKNGVKANLELLAEYRDAAVHLYNAKGFDVVVYGLAQTCIVNLNELLREVFGKDLTDEVTWKLLPLGIAPPVSALDYLRGARSGDNPAAVDDFIRRLSEEISAVEESGGDTGKVFTVFDVSLETVKKMESADVVVGVSDRDPGTFVVQRPLDPNRSPLSMMEAVRLIQKKVKVKFSRHDFIAVAWYHKSRDNPQYMWANKKGNVIQWSHEAVNFMARLSPRELDEARDAYREHLREHSKPKT